MPLTISSIGIPGTYWPRVPAIPWSSKVRDVRSSTIGGVAVAISLGGPGAALWLVVAGLLGMSSKFVECTLGVVYRRENPDGTVSGGPMYYLERGLAEHGWPRLGRGLGVFYAAGIVIGCLGIGNMFQSNQAYAQLLAVTGGEANTPGQTWTGKFNLAGKIMLDFEGSLLEIEENKLYKTNTKGPIDSESTWTYEAHDDGTTTISANVEYELSGAVLGKIADKLFVERKTASDLQETLESFKRILEAE